ncbi:hypothetical protein TNCV_4273431 [Trichonephila clavipes]|nr:hypothetical protein TNCV_4273431 [Trichonephila clavipes]
MDSTDVFTVEQGLLGRVWPVVHRLVRDGSHGRCPACECRLPSEHCAHFSHQDEIQRCHRNETNQWYWDRTRDQASHDPIPIPLGYRGHTEKWNNASKSQQAP